jgi:hypothetical protein
MPWPSAATGRSGSSRQPGPEPGCDVGKGTLVLPADPTELRVTRGDPTPVAPLAGGVLWALLEATEVADSAPLWSVVPGMVAFGALAAWSTRVLKERGEGAHGQIIRIAFLAALVQPSVVHAAVRGSPNRPDGSQRCPIQVAFSAPAVIAGFCGPSLNRRARTGTALVFGAVLACGLALLEPPRWRRDLALNFLWNLAAFFPAVAHRAATDRDAKRTLGELHERVVDAAEAEPSRASARMGSDRAGFRRSPGRSRHR